MIEQSGSFCFLIDGCTADTDCNDGLYCNGEETCDLINGNCNPGEGDPCQPGGVVQ